MSAYTTPSHHLWASPGIRVVDPLQKLTIDFDRLSLDFVVRLPRKVGEAISDFELPHLCPLRPHEDPHIEAWLARWVDGIEPEGMTRESSFEESLLFTGHTLLGLTSLANERPEVCPMLRSQLENFESILAAWLREWPQAEPARDGLARTREGMLCSAPTAEELELELHTALAFLRSGVPQTSVALSSQLATHVKQVALGWTFKLESVYGLPLSHQPERAAAAAATAANATGGLEPWQLSILSWDVVEVDQLLRCPFFRPQELSVWQFAQRWQLEGFGASSIDMELAIDDILVWELLPSRESLGSISGEREPIGRAPVEPSEEEEGIAPSEGGQRQSLEEDIVVAAALSESVVFIPGSSFTIAPRCFDPVMATHDDPASLHLSPSSTSGAMRCWNVANESQVVGAGRQMIASQIAASSAGGLCRFDLRVLSGTEAESAHLFEVGLAANPAAGVQFKVSGPGAFHPDDTGDATSFFSLVSVLDALLEGVRIAVEVDFTARLATVRNIPAVEGMDTETQPTPLAPWLDARARHLAMRQRPPGEQEDSLFREQATHLHELIAQGSLHEDLADTVLSDAGARCIRGVVEPETPEEYYFYVVVPAGMEIEIF